MSYRNKTYVVFDGDNDMWAYVYMKGWKKNKNIEFNFHDAHDLNTITDRASEDTVKRRLRERFSSAKQIVVLIGDHTRTLYRFVRWEMEVAQKLDLPVIAVNLNGSQSYDSNLCPRSFATHILFMWHSKRRSSSMPWITSRQNIPVEIAMLEETDTTTMTSIGALACESDLHRPRLSRTLSSG